jgi:hypothetical protein
MGDIEHSELPANKERMSMSNNDQRNLYPHLNCGMIDIIRGQLNNRSFEILTLNLFYF